MSIVVPLRRRPGGPPVQAREQPRTYSTILAFVLIDEGAVS
jgi:hypothetical protein